MRSGPLRHRVEIQQRTATPNSLGATVESWATTATVWGAIEPLAGKEVWWKAEETASATHRIRIRYRSGLNSKDYRFRKGDRVFAIGSLLNPDERSIEHLAICTERLDPVAVVEESTAGEPMGLLLALTKAE